MPKIKTEKFYIVVMNDKVIAGGCDLEDIKKEYSKYPGENDRTVAPSKRASVYQAISFIE